MAGVHVQEADSPCVIAPHLPVVGKLAGIVVNAAFDRHGVERTYLQRGSHVNGFSFFLEDNNSHGMAFLGLRPLCMCGWRQPPTDREIKGWSPPNVVSPKGMPGGHDPRNEENVHGIA